MPLPRNRWLPLVYARDFDPIGGMSMKTVLSSLLATLAAATVVMLVPADASVAVHVRGRACTIEGSAGEDRLEGTAGRDVICSKGGDDRIDARAGNDIVFAGAGNDSVAAGGGNDTYKGGPGRDYLSGGPGSDKLLGGGGNEVCLYSVGGGSDRINGGPGTDRYRADSSDTVVRAERPVQLCPPFPPRLEE